SNASRPASRRSGPRNIRQSRCSSSTTGLSKRTTRTSSPRKASKRQRCLPPTNEKAPSMTRRFAVVVLLIAMTAATLRPAADVAQGALPSDLENFYRGKQMRVIVRSGPGGGFDLYSRLLGRFIVKHIPGNPTTVVQNMPAGGGIAAIAYVGEVAPQDGTVI